MTEQQKKYIEDNIKLIENNNWEAFFENAPQGVGSVIYEAGIDFMLPLKRVPVKSFSESSVTYVNIPDGVTSIEPYAFYDCSNLKRITIPDSVTSIGVKAFFECSRLESITIGNSVTSIEPYAFYYCSSLSNITILNSVTSIGNFAFYNCGRIKINYNGTVAQWKQLIGNNDSIFKFTTYTCNCSDGTIKESG